ncbi:hypothetical protein ACRALDRAFT_207383 [Sodiomyces alcalophilus JCM 7366]|uniref:uncharacterized protein n=1 Tax=Sodiomyces alcalophilus JCM 7366 TaxID=591952 RepID=UPI0039B67A8B
MISHSVVRFVQPRGAVPPMLGDLACGVVPTSHSQGHNNNQHSPITLCIMSVWCRVLASLRSTVHKYIAGLTWTWTTATLFILPSRPVRCLLCFEYRYLYAPCSVFAVHSTPNKKVTRARHVTRRKDIIGSRHLVLIAEIEACREVQVRSICGQDLAYARVNRGRTNTGTPLLQAPGFDRRCQSHVGSTPNEFSDGALSGCKLEPRIGTKCCSCCPTDGRIAAQERRVACIVRLDELRFDSTRQPTCDRVRVPVDPHGFSPPSWWLYDDTTLSPLPLAIAGLDETEVRMQSTSALSANLQATATASSYRLDGIQDGTSTSAGCLYLLNPANLALFPFPLPKAQSRDVSGLSRLSRLEALPVLYGSVRRRAIERLNSVTTSSVRVEHEFLPSGTSATFIHQRI